MPGPEAGRSPGEPGGREPAAPPFSGEGGAEPGAESLAVRAQPQPSGGRLRLVLWKSYPPVLGWVQRETKRAPPRFWGLQLFETGCKFWRTRSRMAGGQTSPCTHKTPNLILRVFHIKTHCHAVSWHSPRFFGSCPVLGWFQREIKRKPPRFGVRNASCGLRLKGV